MQPSRRPAAASLCHAEPTAAAPRVVSAAAAARAVARPAGPGMRGLGPGTTGTRTRTLASGLGSTGRSLGLSSGRRRGLLNSGRLRLPCAARRSGSHGTPTADRTARATVARATVLWLCLAIPTDAQ